MEGQLFIGLMSGTSVDGVDAALVKFESHKELNVLATLFTPYDKELKQEINDLAHNKEQLDESLVRQLDSKLCAIYAQCSLSLIEKSGFDKSAITAIANHGQTIRHAPDAKPGYSIQLGQSDLIRQLTGITTIGQFRQGDLANGGQGAPLMPAFHNAVFTKENSAIINLGGIANISVLSKPVVGYDTGPGNTLMDQWILRHQNKSYDANGDWAAQGKAIPSITKTLLDDAYFLAAAPKSTGPDYFNLAWLESKINNLDSYRTEDIQASLLYLSVESLARSIESEGSKIEHVFICGGGANNTKLMSLLKTRLKKHNIATTDEFNIPADWVEAVGFAWLGYCCHHNIKSNLPSVTGAKKSVVLGETSSV